MVWILSTPIQLICSTGYYVFITLHCPNVCPVPTWTFCRAGESITHMHQWRHHMTASNFKPSSYLILITILVSQYFLIYRGYAVTSGSISGSSSGWCYSYRLGARCEVSTNIPPPPPPPPALSGRSVWHRLHSVRHAKFVFSQSLLNVKTIT